MQVPHVGVPSIAKKTGINACWVPSRLTCSDESGNNLAMQTPEVTFCSSTGTERAGLVGSVLFQADPWLQESNNHGKS